MKKIFDENMIVKKGATRDGIKYYRLEDAPFEIHGVTQSSIPPHQEWAQDAPRSPIPSR